MLFSFSGLFDWGRGRNQTQNFMHAKIATAIALCAVQPLDSLTPTRSTGGTTYEPMRVRYVLYHWVVSLA